MGRKVKINMKLKMMLKMKINTKMEMKIRRKVEGGEMQTSNQNRSCSRKKRL